MAPLPFSSLLNQEDGYEAETYLMHGLACTAASKKTIRDPLQPQEELRMHDSTNIYSRVVQYEQTQ